MTKIVKTPSSTSQCVKDSQNATLDEVASWFDAAVVASGKKAEIIAFELGLSSSQLSDMRSGRRRVALDRIVPWLKTNREAALAWVNAQCLSMGLLTTRMRPQRTKREAQKHLAENLKRSPHYQQMVSQMARDMGISEEVAEAILNEPTRH